MAYAENRIHPWAYLIPTTVFLVFHLVINLATIGLYPVVWLDEVRLADPGVNIFLGNGYTTSSYAEHAFGEPFSDRPLFPFTLAAWLTLFGFSLKSVRAFGLVCAAAAVFLGIIAARRSGLVHSRWHLLLLAVTWLWTYGAAFSYRTSRIEPLIMLLLAASFAASTIKAIRVRVALLFLFGVLLALVGLQSVVFLVAFAAFCGPLLPKQYRVSVAVVTCAAIGGTISMAALLAFLELDHAGYALDMFYRHSVLGTLLSAEHEYTHINNIPKSPSFTILLICIVLINVFSKVTTAYSRFAFISFFTISGVFVLLAHFPTYYTWFAVAPAVTALVADLENQETVRKRLVTAALCSTCLVGLPIQLGSALLYRGDRDFQSIDAVLRENLSSSDRVYSDYSAYYTVKSICPASSFFGDYLDRMSEDEKRQINVVVVAPDFATQAQEVFGGSWGQEVRVAVPAERPWSGWSFRVGLLEANYDLVLLRRRTQNP